MSRYHTEHKDKVSKLIPEFEKCAMGGADATSPSTKNKPKPCVLISTRRGLHYFRPNVFGSKFKLKDEYFILDIEEIEYLSEFTRKFYVRGKAPIEFTSPHIDAVVTDLLKSAAEFSIESSVSHEIALTKWQGTKPTTPDVKRHDKLTMYRYKNVCEMYHITRDNTNLRPLEFYENTNRNSIYINGFSSQPEGVEGMALSIAYEGSLHTIHCHAFAPQNVCLMLRKILKISRSVKCIHFMEYEDMSFEFGRFGRIKNLAINSLIITKCFNNPIRLIQFILEFKFARNDFQKLELNNCKMNKRCAVEFGKALATFNCFRTLEILVIRGLETDPKEGNAVYTIIYEATKHLPFLCQFAIEGWQPKIQITPEISNIEAKYLTHLSLSNCILVDMPDPKFAPTIKNFNFSGSVFSLRTFQLLMDALNKHPTYFRLELGELEFPQKDLLAFFDKNRTVFTDRMIEFSWAGNTLSAQTIPGIVNYFIKSPNLKFLDLSRCFSNKSGGVLDQFFMQILGVPLWGIRIFADENTQLGPEIVSKVTKIQSLVSVSLFGHHITDQNIRDLMILPHLGELIVDRTDIDDLDKLFNVYREYVFKKGSIFSFIPPITDSQRLHGKRIQEILDFKNQCIKWLYPGDEFVRSEYYSQYGPDMTHYRKFLENFPISRRKLPRLEPLCSSDFPRNTQHESSLTQKQVEKAKNGFAAEQISLLPSLLDPPEKLADDVFEHPEWLKQMIKDFNVRKRQYNYATPAPEDPEDKIDEAEIQASLLVVEEELKVEEHVEEANVEVPQTPDVEVKTEINAEINSEVEQPEVSTPTIEVKKGKGKKNKKSKAKKEENSDSNEEIESSAKFDIPDAVNNTPKVDFDIKKSSSSDSESTPETISHLSPKSPRSLVPDADIPVPQSSLIAQNVTQRSVNINYDFDVSDHDEFNMKTPEDYTLIDLMLACNFSMFEHIANDIDNSRYDYFAKASLDSAIFANKTYSFFARMVDIELAPITEDSKNLIFRGNAVPARVVGAWPRIVAKEWLTQVLRPAFEVIITFLNQGDGFVVQPSKLPEGQNLEHNKKNFRVILTKCVQAILDGESTMPDPLVYAAQIIVQKVSEKFDDFAFNILTSFLFLRFIIPAFSSTQMVGLPPTEPGPLKDALIQTAAIIMTSVLKGRVDEKGPHFEQYNDFAQWTHDRVQEMYREIVAREVTRTPPKVKVDEMKTIVAIHTEAWPIIDKLEHDVDQMTDPEESANGQKFIAMIRRMGPPPYTGEIMPISEVRVQIKPPKMPMPKVPVSPKNLESVQDEFAPEIESPRVDIDAPNAPEFDDKFGQDFDSTSSSEEEEKKKKKRGWSAIFKRNKKKQEDKAKIKGAKGDVDVNANIKGPKVESPKAEISTPGFGANVSTPKAGFGTPVISPPYVESEFGTNIESPKAEISAREIDVNAPKAEISTPSVSAPHGEAGIDVNVGKPSLDVNAPSISAPNGGAGFDVDVNAPKAEISTPGIGINTPSVSVPHGEAEFSVDINAPEAKISKPEFGANIKSSNAEVSTPSIGGGLNIGKPQIDVNAPKAEISTPSVSAPHGEAGFDVNVGKPSLDVNAPSVSAPHGDGFGVSVEAPKVDVNTPKADVSAPGLGFGAGSPHGKAGFGVNVEKPSLDVNAPNTEVSTTGFGVNAPHGDGFGVNVDAPKVDVNAPKAEISAPGFGTNIKGPKVDAKKPSIGGGLKIESPNVYTPKAEISAPEFDANAPHGDTDFGVNVRKPQIDINAPKTEITKPGFGAIIEKPNIDINAPKAEISTPGIGINAPSVSAPHGEAGFDIDVNAPKVSAPGFGANIKGPKVESPKAEISTPEFGANIGKPSLDVNAPKAEVSTSGLGFGEGIEGPNVDVKTPSIKVESPKVNAPKAEISAPHGEAGFGVNVGQPSLDVNAPNVEVNAPKISSPKAQIDVNAPSTKVSTSGIGGMYEGFKFKDKDEDEESSSDGKRGRFGLFKRNQKAKEAKIKGKVDVPKPGIKVESPDVSIGSPSGKGSFGVKTPEVSSPGFNAKVSSPKVDSPQGKAGFGIHADTPNVSVSTPTIGGGIEVQDATIHGGKTGQISSPDVDIHGPHIEAPKVEVSSPQGNVSAPGIQGNVSIPQGEISTPDIGAGISGGIQTPHVESPKADISSPSINVNGPQGQFSSPYIQGNVSVPQGQISSPGINVSVPQGQVSGPGLDADVRSPHVEAPKAEISTPGIGTGIHGGVSVPQGDVSIPGISGPHVEVPNVSGSVSVPQGQLSTPQKQISGPGFTSPQGQISSPTINVSSPRVESPKAEISTPGIGTGIYVGASSQGINVTSPQGQISSPSINVNSPQGQFSSPNIHGNVSVPQGQISSPGINVNGPRVESPKAQISTPGIGGGINVTGPQGQISSPGIGGDVKVPQGRVGFNVPSGRASIKGAVNVQSRDVNVEIPEEDFEEEDYEEEYEEEETATEASEVEVVASAQPQVGTTEISGGLFTRNIPVDNKVTMFSDDEMKSKKPAAELDAINTKVKSGKPMKIQAPKIGGFQGRLVKMAGESRQSSSSSDSDDLPAIFNMHASAAAAVANQHTPSVPQRIQRRPLMKTIGQADRIVPMPGMTNDETITEDHSPNRNNLPVRNQQFLLQTQDKKNPQPSGYIQQNNVENSETEDSGPPTAFLIQKGVIPPKAAASVPSPAPAPTTTEDTSPKSRDSRRMRRQNDITEDSIEYNSRKHRPTRGRPDISGVKARSVRDEDESEEENNRRSYRSRRNNDDYDDRDHHRHHYGSRRSHRNNSISDDDDKYRSRGRRPRYHDDDDDYNRRYRSRRHRHENNDDDDDYNRHRSRSHRGYRHHRDETSSDYDNRKVSPSAHSSEEENNKVQQQQRQQSQPQSPRSARSRRPMHDSGSVSSRHKEKLPAYPEAAPQQSSTSEKQQKKQDKEKASTTSGEYVTASNIYTADKLYEEVSADNNQQDSWIAAPQLDAKQNTKQAEKTEKSSESVSYDLSTEEMKKSKKPEAEKKVTDEEEKPKKAESSAPEEEEKESSEHSYEEKKVEITLSTTAEGTEDNTKDDTSVASLNSISLRKRDKQPKKSSSAERQKKESSSTKKKAPPRIAVGGIDEDDPDKTMISEDFFASPEKKPSVLAPLPLPESPRHIKASEKAKYNAQRPKTPAPDPIEMKPSSVRVRPQYTLAKPRSLNVDVPLMGQPRKRTRVPRK